MTRFKVMLLAAAATGFSGATSAMPMSNLAAVTEDLTQNVRLVCDQWGSCYQTRRYVRGGYWRAYPHQYYAPRAYGYYGTPYRYYGAPQIGFSFGFGHRGWGW